MKLLLDLQGAQTESRLRGIGRQTRSLARAIAESDRAEVHCLLNGRLRDGLEDLAAEFAALLPPGRIHVFGVAGPVAEREPANLWRTGAAECVREAAIAALRPDIVHLGSLFEGYVDDAVTSIGRFETDHLTAVTLHDLIPLADPERYLAADGPRRHWLRRAQFLKRADLLLAVSAHSAGEAERRLHIPPERIAVIGAGVDARFAPRRLAGAAEADLRRRLGLAGPFLLHVGAVDPRKNVGLLLRAFARLPERLRRGRSLVFAGRLFADEMAGLSVAAGAVGLPREALHFLQHVTDDDLIALYGLADAFVVPSTHEGFGLPALEAMACGAPTLAADRTSLPEVVGNPDLLFDPTDPASLADRLTRVLAEPAFAAEARRWGLERARLFTWAEAADKALDALGAALARSRAAGRGSDPARPALRRRKRLAFVSPLPGDRSGIADYSAELLPELARFYDIECVVGPATTVTDPWVLANFPIRDIAFFSRNAAGYDRILYSIGNSHHHAHMPDLLATFPGTVLLHDFFLSDLIDWESQTGGRPYEDFFRELYRGHGLTGLAAERRERRIAAVTRFACNASVFAAADGVIVHSRWSVEAARALYGSATADGMAVIPHLRAVARPGDRAAARRRLGIAADAFLVCSFGVVTARKRSREVLAGWAAAGGASEGGRLVFVGGDATDAYGEGLAAEASRLGATLTGYAPASLYRDYLQAADLAVQLRSESRGETSGTVLDCLAAGLPAIVNAHGPLAELPDDVVCRLPAGAGPDAVADAIGRLRGDPALRRRQAASGLRHLAAHHAPAAIGERFQSALESFAGGRAACDRALLGALADLATPMPAGADDLRGLARIIAPSRPAARARQILYDVTVLSETDARTGIQRVARGILAGLVDHPPPGYRVEPVRMLGDGYRYARAWTAGALDLPSWVLPDDPVEVEAGDIYLSIDWVPDRLPNVEGWLMDLRRAGGRVAIGVHDLLPLSLPRFFPDYMPGVTTRWIETAFRTADQLLCVSRTVADEVAAFGAGLDRRGRPPVAIDWFHNAADLAGSLPTTGPPPDAEAILAAFRARPTFLMVGTVEPRKGHAQVLAALDRLWAEGLDIGLAIVGKAGWMMEPMTERLSAHREMGRRLHWLPGISDEFLDDVYAGAAALVAASAGEGFGLPLVEAARHGCPLIARDIPVFREVAGEGALYFSGKEPESVATAIRNWLEMRRAGQVPDVSRIPVRTWAETTAEIVERLLSSIHYRIV